MSAQLTGRFVPVKSIDQQSLLMLHRMRDLLIRQRTMVRAPADHPSAKQAGPEGPAGLVNALRGHFAELGIVVGQGIRNVGKLVGEVEEADDARVPPTARGVMSVIVGQLAELQERIRALETDLLTWHRENDASRRLATIPGIGPITATALVATVTHAGQFRSAREFSAWIGLVPRQHSSGGKERLGGISKRGDAYLRRLLIHRAAAAARSDCRRHAGP
jgi:transposase